MANTKLFHMERARSEHQRQNMAKASRDGVCLFCPKHISKYHASPIERKGKFWMITKNDYPYEGTRLHYLFIYNQHVTSFNQIKPGAMEELLGHLKWLEKKFHVEGGAIVWRFGNSNHNFSSITHLHGHIIVGAKRGRGKEPLNVYVGYRK